MQKSVLSFHQTGPKDQTQAIGFGSKHPYLLRRHQPTDTHNLYRWWENEVPVSIRIEIQACHSQW